MPHTPHAHSREGRRKTESGRWEREGRRGRDCDVQFGDWKMASNLAYRSPKDNTVMMTSASRSTVTTP